MYGSILPNALADLFRKSSGIARNRHELCNEPEQHIQQGRYPSFTGHLRAKLHQHGWKVIAQLAQKSLFYLLNRCLRTTLRRFHIRLDQRAVRSSDLVLANSRYTAARIRAIYDQPSLVCYLGVRTQELPSLSPCAKQNYFLTVTRLERLKHVDSIIQAVSLLVKQRHLNDVSLVVIGKGTEEIVLKNLVTQCGLEEHVRFEGYVADEDLPRYYRERWRSSMCLKLNPSD